MSDMTDNTVSAPAVPVADYATPDADIIRSLSRRADERALSVPPRSGGIITMPYDHYVVVPTADPETEGLAVQQQPEWRKISQCTVHARIPNFYDGHMGVYTRLFTLACESVVTTSRGEPLATCRETFVVEDIHAFTDEDRNLDVSNGPAVDDPAVVIRREGRGCAWK